MTSAFVFCSCQPGAESLLKAEVEARLPGWRFAFSRPGFVTFRLPKEVRVDRIEPPRLTFARTIGVSLDRLEVDDLSGLPDQVWSHPAVQSLTEAGPVSLHVWRRDTALPGDDGVEPGPTDETRAAYDLLSESSPQKAEAPADTSQSPADQATTPQPAGPRVALDVMQIDPGKWWLGAHTIRSRTDRWPGGVPPLQLPGHAVSRAYLKLQEAFRWSAMPARRGETWIELGCSPGGASQALLDAGMRVIGVDPAEVDPVVAADPGFTHLRHRSAECPLDPLKAAHWLTADVNAAPSYTLNAVESIVTNDATRIRGLLLTMKLLSVDLARPEKVAEVIEWVRSWGYADVRARQLAFNRREYCVAALPSRSQRRMRRGKKPRRVARESGD